MPSTVSKVIPNKKVPGEKSIISPNIGSFSAFNSGSAA